LHILRKYFNKLSNNTYLYYVYIRNYSYFYVMNASSHRSLLIRITDDPIANQSARALKIFDKQLRDLIPESKNPIPLFIYPVQKKQYKSIDQIFLPTDISN